MKTIYKVMEYQPDHFDELIASLSDEDIEAMGTEYHREDFSCDFIYKVSVVRDWLKAMLIMDLECNERIGWLRELFEFYYKWERYTQTVS